MAKKKKVGFNFFRVMTQVEAGTYRRLDLRGVLEHYRQEYARDIPERQKIVYEYNGEQARLTGITVDMNGLYHIWFERLVNYQLPVITTLHGESEFIEIEESEFIGREVSALYDPDQSIMMIQRNRDSLGPSAIDQVLNTLVNNTEAASNCSLIAIEDQEASRRGFTQSKYRKISIKVKGRSARDLWTRITGDPNSDGVDNLEFTVGTDRRRDSEIEEDVSRRILQQYVENEDTSKLKIHGRDEEQSPVEPIDLLNQRLEVFTTLNYNDQQNFNPITIYQRMLDLYRGTGTITGAVHQIQRMR
ncbi:MAG: DUF6731 family protein [Bacillota bacterium]